MKEIEDQNETAVTIMKTRSVGVSEVNLAPLSPAELAVLAAGLPPRVESSADDIATRLAARRSRVVDDARDLAQSNDGTAYRATSSPSPTDHLVGKTYSQAELDEAIRQEREGCAFAVECHSGFGDPSSIEACASLVRARGDEADDCIHVPKEIYARLISPPQGDLEGPQDISTAPPMTDVLVWWPIVKLDEDGDPTDEIVGGCWIISEDQGGYWIEPEVMNAIGDHMGDDHTYADKPSKWLPLPAPLFTAASEGLADV